MAMVAAKGGTILTHHLALELPEQVSAGIQRARATSQQRLAEWLAQLRALAEQFELIQNEEFERLLEQLLATTLSGEGAASSQVVECCLEPLCVVVAPSEPDRIDTEPDSAPPTAEYVPHSKPWTALLTAESPTNAHAQKKAKGGSYETRPNVGDERPPPVSLPTEVQAWCAVVPQDSTPGGLSENAVAVQQQSRSPRLSFGMPLPLRQMLQTIGLGPAVEPERIRPKPHEPVGPGEGSPSSAALGRRRHRPRWQRKLAELVGTTQYQVVCSTIIVFNSLFVGICAEYQLKHDLALREGARVDRGWKDQVSTLDGLFCVWFTTELSLNFAAGPLEFFLGKNWRWYLFDLLLVLNCVLESVLEGAIPNFGDYVRTLRIFRTARVLRIIRVFRVFTSLRLMVFAIAQSMLSLLWVFLLLVLLMYVFAIFFMNAVDDYALRPSGDAVILQNLDDGYGSTVKCFLSLFMGISGGADWRDLVEPFEAVDWWYKYVYVIYIFFVVFGVLNVVTGSFVDSFYVVSQADRDTVIEDALKKHRKYTKDIQCIFEEADVDGSGLLSLEEFEAHMQNPRVKAFFTSLELDTSQARALFMLMDTDDTNEVGIEEFVSGCMRLKGEAKNIDVNMLLYENEYMINRINTGLFRIEEKLGVNQTSTPSSSKLASAVGARNKDSGTERDRAGEL